MRPLAIALLGLVPLHLGDAQSEIADEPGAEAIFALEVKVVNVLATVKDRQGKLRSDLGKEDFILEEDGVRQDIRYFAHQTDLPLTIGLLIDTSGSQEALIPEEQRAGALFFQSLLRPEKDLAFLMSFDRNVELLQDYTGSLALLQRGLEQLRVELPSGGYHPNPTGRQPQPTSTALHDALFLAADEMFRNQVGRKVIVVVSDGYDFGSKTKLKDAVEAAQRADTVVYAIQYLDLHRAAASYMRLGAGSGVLKRIAEATGGTFFRANRGKRLAAIFRQIEEEMRSQYSIGYTPKRDLENGGFRRIKLKSQHKGLTVQARDGYYAEAI